MNTFFQLFDKLNWKHPYNLNFYSAFEKRILQVMYEVKEDNHQILCSKNPIVKRISIQIYFTLVQMTKLHEVEEWIKLKGNELILVILFFKNIIILIFSFNKALDLLVEMTVVHHHKKFCLKLLTIAIRINLSGTGSLRKEPFNDKLIKDAVVICKLLAFYS